MPPSSYCKDAERGRRTEREQEEEEEEEAGSNKRGQQKKGQNERKAGKEIRGGRKEGAGEEMRNWTEGGKYKGYKIETGQGGGKVRSGDSRRRRGLAVVLWQRSWGKKKRREERWRGGMESNTGG